MWKEIIKAVLKNAAPVVISTVAGIALELLMKSLIEEDKEEVN